MSSVELKMFKIMKFPDRVFRVSTAILLFGMMTLTFLDVLARYLFNKPIPASFELTELMLGTIIFAALPAVTWRQKHVVIDLLDNFVPDTLRFLHRRVIDLISSLVFGVGAWVVWLQAGKIAAANVGTEILEIPLAPIAYFISVMLGVTSLLLVRLTVWGDGETSDSATHSERGDISQ